MGKSFVAFLHLTALYSAGLVDLSVESSWGESLFFCATFGVSELLFEKPQPGKCGFFRLIVCFG